MQLHKQSLSVRSSLPRGGTESDWIKVDTDRSAIEDLGEVATDQGHAEKDSGK
jgi:hypothetical protein